MIETTDPDTRTTMDDLIWRMTDDEVDAMGMENEAMDEDGTPDALVVDDRDEILHSVSN